MSNMENDENIHDPAAGNTSQKPAASDLVRSFLKAMERRDLELARGYLSLDFSMTFPGNAQFTDLEKLVVWGKQRYRTIAKSYTQFDEMIGDKETIVYCFGTLQGTLLDGSEFQGIRFIDRFTVRDGTLLDQKVWNDMGEVLGSI